MLLSYKLDRVYYDNRGNLIAIRKGTGGAKAVVFDAHLDTVFQPGLKIKAEVRDGKIFAPGVGDNTRNIEALLATIRALDAERIRTRADLIFVFSVEEETKMSGAKYFVQENRDRIGQYVALDGGFEGLTYGGIGINWYKHHFIGPGGHTRSRTPPYSATLPLARAIARIYALELPEEPMVNINIGMLGGSEVVNAKAADAWFTVDLRSTDQKLIDEFEQKIAAIVKEEADRVGIQAKTELIDEKFPAAQIPGNRQSFTVRMSEAVHRAIGMENVTVIADGFQQRQHSAAGGAPGNLDGRSALRRRARAHGVVLGRAVLSRDQEDTAAGNRACRVIRRAGQKGGAMRGSKLLFLASWVILLILSAFIAAASAASMSNAYFGPTDELTPNGVTLEQIRAAGGERGDEAVKAFRGRRATAATWALGAALLSIFVVVIPYRRGQRWAWWALLASIGLSQLLSLARAVALGTTFGTGTPAIILSVLLIGLLAGVPRMFKKSDDALIAQP